ncbi:hypothetical protein DUI87_33352 [Hirundo rustica rustica]|uniref:Uncharacterized protein n=1 Tax=Hirundo rustica rustica TaxID=333673 RepID=A0A3M0J6K9_HIRRU|nr:hypothetical protein DUI87_33352 [Hirundo rustica rustica]
MTDSMLDSISDPTVGVGTGTGQRDLELLQGISSRDSDRVVHAHAGIPSAAVPGIRGRGRSRLESGIAHGGLPDRGESLTEFRSFPPGAFGEFPQGIPESSRVRIRRDPESSGWWEFPRFFGCGSGGFPVSSRCGIRSFQELFRLGSGGSGILQVGIRRFWNSPGWDQEVPEFPRLGSGGSGILQVGIRRFRNSPGVDQEVPEFSTCWSFQEFSSCGSRGIQSPPGDGSARSSLGWDQEVLEFPRCGSGVSGILHLLELPGVFQVWIRSFRSSSGWDQEVPEFSKLGSGGSGILRVGIRRFRNSPGVDQEVPEFSTCWSFQEFSRCGSRRIQSPPGDGSARSSPGWEQEVLEFSRLGSGGSGILHLLQLPGILQLWIRRIRNSLGVDPEGSRVRQVMEVPGALWVENRRFWNSAGVDQEVPEFSTCWSFQEFSRCGSRSIQSPPGDGSAGNSPGWDQEVPEFSTCCSFQEFYNSGSGGSGILWAWIQKDPESSRRWNFQEFSRCGSGGSGILHLLELPGVLQVWIRRIWNSPGVAQEDPESPHSLWEFGSFPELSSLPIPALNSLREGAGRNSSRKNQEQPQLRLEIGKIPPGGIQIPVEFWDLISEGFSNLSDSMIHEFQEWLREEIPSAGLGNFPVWDKIRPLQGWDWENPSGIPEENPGFPAFCLPPILGGWG